MGIEVRAVVVAGGRRVGDVEMVVLEEEEAKDDVEDGSGGARSRVRRGPRSVEMTCV